MAGSSTGLRLLHQVLAQGLFQPCFAEAFVDCLVLEVIYALLRL